MEKKLAFAPHKVQSLTPLNDTILVDEMKKMRQEFSSKSNDVYMDGSKVTSNLKRVGDKSNRNNFALA